jgi:hypothetical protein
MGAFIFHTKTNSIMKKQLFIISALLIWASVVTAQPQKGNVLIGTSANINGGYGLGAFGLFSSFPNQVGIGFGSIKSSTNGQDDDEKIKYSTFNVSPNIGYFITNDFMLGANVGLLNIKAKLEDEEAEIANIISFTPMLRYYIPAGSTKLLPYLEARGGIAQSKYGDDDDDKQNATLFGGKIGGAIFLKSQVSLDLFLDYTNATVKEEYDFGGTTRKDKTVDSSFGFGLGLSVFL